MRHFLFGTAFASLLLTSAPGFAASPETDAFVANIRINSVFLTQSSKMAGDRSENGDLQAFANCEIEDQGNVIAAVEERTAPAIAQHLPMTVASNDMVTGRSAAVTTDVTAEGYSAPVGTGALMPAALISLDHLSSAKGEAFDTLYKATQINALRQMAALYNAYSMTGDNDGLRQMAKSELAATNRAIAEIARF